METPVFHCRFDGPTTPLPHFWEHTVGSCHAPLALRSDWQAQLRRCHLELGFRYVRFHDLLSDTMSTLVAVPAPDTPAGKRLIYSFFHIDQAFDFLLSIGMKPFVELSFMPKAIASGTTTVFHYGSNVTPPADYKQWAELVHRLTRHCVERYGLDEVRTWFFEVWNEPNWKDFWTGTQADYFELYRHSAWAIKQVDAGLRVGGPSTAKNEWVAEFLDFCERNGLPADFVSTHQYPNDPLWSATQDTEAQLAGSRRGVMREWLVETHRQARGRPVYYTEWNASSNPRYPPQDEPYSAAFVVKTVMEAAGLVDCYSFWTFSDLFEENYFPSVPFHGGFGLLNIHGIPKPNYRAFELLHRLGDEQLPVEGAHSTVDAWAVKRPASLTVLLSNHALPRHPIGRESVRCKVVGAPRPRGAFVERIDEHHANPKRRWREMGAPEYLNAAEIEQLEQASRMVRDPQPWEYQDGAIVLGLELPAHAVASVTLEF